MVGLLIYVKKHCIRPEKIGKDTNQLIFQIQLILRMANDQDQVLVFNVVGGGVQVHMYNRQRSGVAVRPSVTVTCMWYPGTTCTARRGEGILLHYWYYTGGVWCAHPLSLTAHSSQSQRYCRL